MSKLRDENAAKCMDMMAKDEDVKRAQDHLESLSASGPGTGGEGTECKEKAASC